MNSIESYNYVLEIYERLNIKLEQDKCKCCYSGNISNLGDYVQLYGIGNGNNSKKFIIDKCISIDGLSAHDITKMLLEKHLDRWSSFVGQLDNSNKLFVYGIKTVSY